MEWNHDANKFERRLPRPSPTIAVEVSVLKEVHQRCGIKCGATYPTVSIQAVTDTGCQTTTAGIDILKMLNVSKDALIPTKHKIVGITEKSLDILGVLMLSLDHKGRTAKQMVYISTRPSGLYLSETALIELGLIDENFPNHDTSNIATIKSSEQCYCLQRSIAPEKPDAIPYAPTRENIPKLKKWLLERFASSGFNQCTHQELGTMTGVPMDIHFKKDVIPHAVHTPIPVPLHWRYQVKDDINRDVRLGIIEQVPQGTPVEWCSRMVVTAKKDMTPRRTVDLQKLKKATLRETHYTRTPFHIVSQTPKNVLKTVLDAWNGYHSLPLSDSARDATTFITEWGRYRYKRAPMGHHSSGDAYTRRFDDITSEFERVSRCVDDSILWDADIAGAFWHTYDYIKLCADNGIVFNPDKFVFAAEICEFAGFEVTMDGYRPTKKILESIRTFPKPTNIHDIRAWFGLVNQVAYAFVQTSQMSPFRDLLKKKSPRFYWDDALEQAFERSKLKIIELIEDGVKTFEMNKVTCVATDYSKMGLGYTLQQKNCNCPKPYTPSCGGGHWNLILAGSRFTTPTEARYAPIEGEALAAAYGLNQCKHFILGCPELVLATDHKPLTKILNDRELDTIENPRLLRMKEKTLRFNFDIVHVTGKLNQAPDAFSRYPRKPEEGELEDNHQTEDDTSTAFALHQSSSLPSSITWNRVNSEAAADVECVGLKEVIEAGFPDNKNQLPEHLKYFWCMKDEVYMIDNVPFKGRKMLIPKSLRGQIVEGLHSGHQGVSSMSANARERLFWPRLDADLRQARKQCRRCNEIAPSLPAETLLTTPEPEMPFEQVAADMFKIGAHSYIVYADRYSGWTEAKKLTTQSFKSIKKCLLDWFKTFGVPNEISTDGGPPFQSADYRSFLKTWDIAARLSSAYYPQSNGRAEVAVKTMKRTLFGNINPTTGELDTEAATRAILAHRNTPAQQSQLSPSELVFGHKMRDHLPNKFRKVRKSWRRFRLAKEIKNRVQTTWTADKSRTHRPLVIGEHVSIQNQHGNKPKRWSNTGKVVEVLPHRKYQVMIDGSKRLTLRNRKFLRRIPATARDGEEPRRVEAPLPPSPSPTSPQRIPRSHIEMKHGTPMGTTRNVEEVCRPSVIKTPLRTVEQTLFPLTPMGRDGGRSIPMASTPRADAPSFRLPEEPDVSPEMDQRADTTPTPIQQPTAVPPSEPMQEPAKAPDNAEDMPQPTRRSSRVRRKPNRLIEQ